MSLWPYFGQESGPAESNSFSVGTKPASLIILGQVFQLGNWRDVLEHTLETIAELEPEKFNELARNYPKFISRQEDALREVRQLENGYFIEVNLSAQSIQKFCHHAIETIELSAEDWKVVLRNSPTPATPPRD